MIESNRSEWQKSLFSRYSEVLTEREKIELLDTYYLPYRNEVINSIKGFINAGHQVIHISVHSFTPVLHDKHRNADVGLLYDPQRTAEKEFSVRWKELLLDITPGLKVRFNYPYLGKSDGFTTSLRKLFPENYVGIELEINQKWENGNRMDVSLKKTIYQSINELIKKGLKILNFRPLFLIYYLRSYSSVISAFNNFDSGQLSFALLAIFSNCSLFIPGTSAARIK